MALLPITAPEEFTQLRPAPRVQNGIPGEPRTPRLIHSAANEVILAGAMRIGRDGDFNTGSRGEASLIPRQVQPVGTRIDFEKSNLLNARVQ
jgi:hypothetical protein